MRAFRWHLQLPFQSLGNIVGKEVERCWAPKDGAEYYETLPSGRGIDAADTQTAVASYTEKEDREVGGELIWDKKEVIKSGRCTEK